MAELCVIVGMGEGNGMAIARRFASEGFAIAMIARNEDKLKGYQATLETEGITAHYFLADAGDEAALTAAFESLQTQLGTPEVLIYNAAVPRMESVLQTSYDTLVNDFRANVAGAIACVQAILPAMQTEQKGTLLFTGGGFALYPDPNFVSLSLGKAGIRVLANTLHAALKDSPIKVGTVTICGTVNGDDPKYNSDLIAEEYWKLHIAENGDYETLY
ncbi:MULTISPECIES: SDR family NAD(P)-dependent oxidoreductase [Cyanophyceae]|uniref:SDR family NAD(P)-dependent oxidoreductase n=1 Tax=Cyanophyceae TaxID=3028117 RepID=UPI0016882815|nr:MULTISPECIES: SDR family NAD(P)-dependent oxidoreductase [Cyanophyceae]MBD1915640.1 SDR family NAD(P)-dependent oxidoreductase [Phormidium sp. FACHB-77]MBD2031950.1 SDR family NAD(P)-dependent oxidoreductase [Phormidium sp. FACHB-322]MBD2050700.1 SDR family NAD(P)-dependent oxidoreductase [Leptolyngbya sp. FACHB-60]